MSIFQQQDKNGRWSMMGDGVVWARADNPAVHESLAFGDKKVPKVNFILKVGTIIEKNEETGETAYKPFTVNCAVYGVKGQEDLYAFACTLQAGETIAFWGSVWEKQSDEGNAYREIQLTSIDPVTRKLRYFLGVDGNDFAKLQVQAARESTANKKIKKGKGDLPF